MCLSFDGIFERRLPRKTICEGNVLWPTTIQDNPADTLIEHGVNRCFGDQSDLTDIARHTDY